MRPNLAFGPIDSVTQYLLYLSIVVLGVLLPLAANKWRTRREQQRLLERTLASLRDEVAANRRRVVGARESYAEAVAVLDAERAHYLALRERLVASPGLRGEPAPDSDIDITLAVTTRTAWDVARLAAALPLLPPASLTAFTRAYHMQELYERDRGLLLQAALRAESLDLPADLSRLEVVDARLHLIADSQAVLRYHDGLAAGMIAAYDALLREVGGEVGGGSGAGTGAGSGATIDAPPADATPPARR